MAITITLSNRHISIPLIDLILAESKSMYSYSFHQIKLVKTINKIVETNVNNIEMVIAFPRSLITIINFRLIE